MLVGVGGGELGLDFGVVFVFTALMVALATRLYPRAIL
jgi:hypothetical protein